MYLHQPELLRQLPSTVRPPFSIVGPRLLGEGRILVLLSSVQIRGPVNRTSSLKPPTYNALHDQSAHIPLLQDSYPYHYFVHFLLSLQQRQPYVPSLGSE